MSSLKGSLKNKRGDTSALKIIMFAILMLAIIFTLIYLNAGGLSAATKTGCFATGIGKGYCIADKSKCDGIINPSAKGCPEKAPFCCISNEEDAGASDGAAETQQDQQTALKGSSGFYCQCRLEEGYLVSDTNANKLDLKAEGRKEAKGGVDFKVKSGKELEVQARGTDDVTYCKISIGSQASGGDCSADDGPKLKYSFAKEGEIDIILRGYDKKNGKQIASAVADITVEK